MQVPETLDHLTRTESGARWLESLDGLVAAGVERWGLTLGAPYPGSYVSLVLPARLPGGGGAVLKVQWPHPESEHEGAALRAWDGAGAISLLDELPERHLLLLERCEPGHHLSTIEPDEGLEVMAGIVERLSVPAASPFGLLTDEACGWADRLPQRWERAGRPFPRWLVDAAVGYLRGLAADETPQILLHQDLHGDNVLAASREPWLAIDPKPLVGDPSFAPAPIIRSYEFGHSRQAVMGRFDLLSERLGLDRERVRGWTIGQTVAWAIEDGAALENHVETATWLLEGVS